MKVIDRFAGEYRFLSNFYDSPFTVDGMLLTRTLGPAIVKSVEHAYQAMKTLDETWQGRILAVAQPGQAKRLGRQAPLREDWEQIKIPVMRQLLALKFTPGYRLATQLRATGNAVLIEGNEWGDTFWGQYRDRGDNWLGHLLMARRAELAVDEWERR